MFLKVIDLNMSYGRNRILNQINLELNKGELVSLVGPSGAGKTTLLKIIARLESYDSGKIVYPDDSSAHRPAVMVFQDYVLFPFLSVFENAAFGLRALKLPKDEIREKVRRILEHFQLADKEHLYPEQLSAGQKQRLAVARALVINPSILLLDEPFANLDRNLKTRTAEFIRKTQKEFNITTLAVTHDLEEAFMISDKMGVMIQGSICQFGTPQEIYHHPADRRIAEFTGHINAIPASLYSLFGITGHPSKEFLVRAENLEIAPDSAGPGLIREVIFNGHFHLYQVELENTLFRVHQNGKTAEPGDRVKLQLNQSLIHHIKEKL